MILRAITGILSVTWLALVIVGKGGFVHLLLLSAVGCGMVEVMSIVRSRMTVNEADKP